ncbi:MAG: N-acetylmuramoyl-L-alanine amidase [Bacteroidaceae bacterium]|nr:N-acetylmuramoyl-L-alanine amidase [Bacteroidaceae bacterium]
MSKQLLHLSLLLLVIATIPLTAVASGLPAAHKYTVVIDAGHGGHDPGAIGKFSKEKNINLNIALEVGRLIENNCKDVRVVYTRKKDVFVTLDGRAHIANKAKADLFISIHTNALPNGRIARGVETYTLGMARAQANLDVAKRENSVILVENNYKEHYAGFNPNSSESYIMFEFMQDKFMSQSVAFAKLVQRNVVRTAGRSDKGVHQAGFLVLRCTSMPSVLVEVGYISTPDEEQYLNSSTGIQNIGRSIYQAFVQYRTQHGKARNARAKETEYTSEPAPAEHEVKVKVEPEQPKPKEQPVVAAQGTEKEDNALVFKVQFLSSPTPLRESAFKGIPNVTQYTEGGRYKYTCYPTSSYDEAAARCKEVKEKFPDAFVAAFRKGSRVDIREAIKEYRNSTKKR